MHSSVVAAARHGHTCTCVAPRRRGARPCASTARRERPRARVDSEHFQASPAHVDVTEPPTRRRALIGGAASAATWAWVAACGCGAARATDNEADDPRTGRVAKTDAEWRALLPAPSYAVLRKASTELPWSSPLVNEHSEGTFCCAGCGAPLFSSATKYDSGTGWPSFFDVMPGAVRETSDKTIPWVPRIEVRCAACEGHLGHVFNDGPPPTGLRYCMNGRALVFQPAVALVASQTL